MKTNNVLSILAISSIMTLSGCAESQTMGSTVGKGAMSLVDSFAAGVQKGIDESFLGNTNKTAVSANNNKAATNSPIRASNTIKSSDMVYLFGWMEDACTGENPAHNGVKKDYNAFIESFYGSNEYNYFVKPRSEWLPEYRDMIKEMKYSDNSSVEIGSNSGEYTVIFKEGVTYRGQPLESHIYTFIKESQGAIQTLTFAPNANIPVIWPNFKTRSIEYWGEMEDMGASYTPQDRTIQCYLT